MNLHLYADDRVRVETSETFIDVQRVGYDSLAINLHPFDGYVEIREKAGSLKVFQFQKKSYKKECDFGYWEDAEVVYSHNRNGKDKS